MTARNRLPPWHELIRLSNGREVLIRPIRPDDAVPLRAGFPLLQPDEIRQRFLHAVKELTPEMADKLTRPDPRTEFAIVAAEPLPPGEALVGAVARVSIDDPMLIEGRREAEFAILVSHYIAGMGLGRHLMRRLVRWAKGKKLDRLYGDVLEHNLPMLTLAQSLDFRREASDTPGLARVVLDLKPQPK
jgi:RimJ/RimL family protein N-acetyltransferase